MRYGLLGVLGWLFAFTPSGIAAIITLDVTVNGGTDPVIVDVGDRVEVLIFGVVTENDLNGIDLGLAAYHLHVTTTGSILQPVQGWDPFLNGWDGQWDAVWANQALLSIVGRGNATNPGFENSVMGHGAAASPGSINSSNHSFAVTRALLATGEFEAVGPGTSFLGPSGTFDGRVIWHDGTGYTTELTPQVLEGGAWITVVPEPASVVLLALGAGGLLLRRRRIV